jgi:uncharacterized protein YjbI with pentapeptide repeats
MGAVETLPYRQTRASGGFRLFGLELPRRPFDLERANLSGHWLQYENFRGANLISANLSGADLSHADLSGANLISANLSGADLNDANWAAPT